MAHLCIFFLNNCLCFGPVTAHSWFPCCLFSHSSPSSLVCPSYSTQPLNIIPYNLGLSPGLLFLLYMLSLSHLVHSMTLITIPPTPKSILILETNTTLQINYILIFKNLLSTQTSPLGSKFLFSICVYHLQLNMKWTLAFPACLHACSVTSAMSNSLRKWTVAHQAPLSMGFSRQEHCSGLPCPPPGDLPDPRTELSSPLSPALQVDSLHTELSEKPILFLPQNFSSSSVSSLNKDVTNIFHSVTCTRKLVHYP